MIGIRIESNVQDVMRALGNIMDDIGKTAVRQAGPIKQVIQTATRRHFQILQWGGTDPTGLRGAVRWPQHRHKMTRALRIDRGRDPVFPMLQISQQPLFKEALANTPLVSSAFVRATGETGSQLWYSPVRSTLTPIIALNQFGQRGPARFSLAGRAGKPTVKMIQYPKRPMLYWDRLTLKQIEKMVVEEYQKSVARNQV